MRGWIGIEGRRVQDPERFERRAIIRRQEQVASEKGSPGMLSRQLDRDREAQIGSGPEIDRDLGAVFEVGDHVRLQRREMLRRYAMVDLPPPDRFAGDAVLDDELVPCGTAGMDAGLDDQRTGLGDARLVSLE